MKSIRLLIPAAAATLLGCPSDDAGDDDSSGPIVVDNEETDSVWDDLSLGFNVTLNAMWGSSAQDLWIVGDGGSIYHWNGQNWTSTPAGTVSDINGVWGTNAGMTVVAVGDGGTVLEWHNDTQEWVAQEFPFVSNLTSILGFAGDDVFVTGYGGLFHWDGSEWSAMSLPANVPLRALWGSTSDDLWVVGDEGTVIRGSPGAWELVPTGETRDLNAVRGDGTKVWVAGEGGVLLEHDGTAFAPDSALGEDNTLWSLWASAGTVVVSGGNAHVYMRTGTEWEELEAGTGVQVVLYGLFAFSANDIYAVGGNGTVLHYPRADGGEGA